MSTTADKPLDLIQASQRIAWMDEERRRDHAELARLAQELAGIVAVLKDQTTRVRETSERVDAVETTLARLPRLEDAITATRSELVPLREADVHLQDTVQRQAKDHESQADQVALYWNGLNGRLDVVTRSIDGLANRLHTLESQHKELAGRVSELPLQLDALGKAANELASRSQLVETQVAGLTERAAAVSLRLEALGKTADGLASHLQLVETQVVGLAERAAEAPLRLDALGKTADGLGARLKLVETQIAALAERTGEFPVRLDGFGKTTDRLAARLQLVETQRVELSQRAAELGLRLDSAFKAADGLANRIQVLETREKDQTTRETALRTQMSRLETSQAQALEELKRTLARAESLIPEMQLIRRQVAAAQDETAKQYKDVVASISDQREATATLERRVEEVEGTNDATRSELQELLQKTYQITEFDGRLALFEEQLAVLQAAAKSFQETQDERWGVEIPEIRNLIEEAHNTTQVMATTVQELLASDQTIKEGIRQLHVDLASEHAFSEDLAAALRGLIEEDVQTRLVMAQKQLQNIRRLANIPVETKPTDEQT